MQTLAGFLQTAGLRKGAMILRARNLAKTGFASSGHTLRKRCAAAAAMPLKFLKDAESGATLVEFTVVAPVFFLLVFGIIQFGSIFSLENAMLNSARDTSRSMAVQGGTAAQAKANAVSYLRQMGYNQNFVVTASPTTVPCTPTDVTVTIVTDAAAASIINYLNMFTGKNLSASVVMRSENNC